MKIQRHAAILRVVRERRIESQDELREVLATEGFTVTQATLSRDIRELGLAKLADPQGGAFYTHPHRAAVRPDLAQVLPALLVSVDGVGPLLVLKTASGSAGAITEALDQAGLGGDHRHHRRGRHGAGDHAQPARSRDDRPAHPGAGQEVTPSLAGTYGVGYA